MENIQSFGLLSLLLYSQRFGRYVLRPFLGVCWIQEPTSNFEPCPDSVNHNRV